MSVGLLDHSCLIEPSFFVVILILICLTWAILFAIFLSHEWTDFSLLQSASVLNMSVHDFPDCEAEVIATSLLSLYVSTAVLLYLM